MKLNTALKFSVALVAFNACGAPSASAANLVAQPMLIEQQVMASPPSVTISLEALALWRWTDDTLLAFDPDTDGEFTTNGIFDNTVAPGARIAIGWALDDKWGVGLSGLYAAQSQSMDFVAADEELEAAYSDNITMGNLEFDNSEGAFNIVADADWSLASLDASATYALNDDFKVAFGPAWMRYSNSIHTSVHDEETTLDFIDDVGISSKTDLFGVKLGLEGMFPATQNISFGGRVAGGIYYATRTLDRSYDAPAESPFNDSSESDSSDNTGWATSVEFSPKVEVALSDNLTISAGGTFIWLNGVDEAAQHYSGIGADDGSGNLAADDPSEDAVQFGGLTFGLNGKF